MGQVIHSICFIKKTDQLRGLTISLQGFFRKFPIPIISIHGTSLVYLPTNLPIKNPTIHGSINIQISSHGWHGIAGQEKWETRNPSFSRLSGWRYQLGRGTNYGSNVTVTCPGIHPRYINSTQKKMSCPKNHWTLQWKGPWTCIAGVWVLKTATFEGSGFLGWRKSGVDIFTW